MNPEEAKKVVQDLQNNYGYVYCLTFSNGKQYIGQTIRQWKYRWKLHKSKNSGCTALHNAIIKYGINDIKFEILTYCKTAEQLNEKEIYYIT